jgi:hypothetical protein
MPDQIHTPGALNPTLGQSCQINFLERYHISPSILVRLNKCRLFSRPETNDSRNVDYGKNKIIRRDDTMTGQNKDRIGAISKDIFSNDDFREANLAILVSKFSDFL